MQLTHSNAFRGDWSPDGQRIAYDTLVLQGGPLEREQRANSIEIAEASTGKLRRKVSAANLQSPVWNSDGTRLTATTNNAVWMIEAETGERHLAVEFPRDFLIIFRAAWSPDGKSVMVNRQERVNKIVLLENFWAP